MVHDDELRPRTRPPARTAYVSARLTPSERTLLESVATNHGVSLSDLVRHLAVRAARELVPHAAPPRAHAALEDPRYATERKKDL